MFWSLVLPFYLTAALLAAMLVAILIWAPKWHWRRRYAGVVGLACALVGFVPVMLIVMLLLHPFRFGTFDYLRVDQIDDHNVEWNLPPVARHIKVHKRLDGNRAQFQLSEAQLRAYLVRLWQGAEPPEVEAVSKAEITSEFGDLGWPILAQAKKYHSPFLASGAGTIYYVDASTGMVYSRTGYW